MKTGIKETKELAFFVSLIIAKAIAVKKEEGGWLEKIKESASKLDELITLAPAAMAAIKGISEVDDELKDLEPAELMELGSAVQEVFPELDVNDAIETAADALTIARAGYRIYQRHND